MANNVKRFPENPRIAFIMHQIPAKLLKVVEMSFEKHSYDPPSCRLSPMHNSLSSNIEE